MTCALVLWVCLGTPAGYVSARIYKSKYFIDKEDLKLLQKIVLCKRTLY